MTIEVPLRARGKSRKAMIALGAVTLIWGATFVWTKQALDFASTTRGEGAHGAGLAWFMVLRFVAAGIVVAVCVPSARRRLDAAATRGGAWLGILLFAGFVLQMRGLEDVSPGVSAFLTSLYVVFVASISAVRERRGLRWPLAIGVVLTTLGAGLIRGRPELAFTAAELMTVACALLFAVHMIATDEVTRRSEPMPVTLVSFVVVAAASAVLLVIELRLHDTLSFGALLDLLHEREFWLPLALMTILGTVVALTLMNLYQREIDPVRAAILYALEPIVASALGIALGLDHFSSWLLVGGSILLAGNLVAELGARKEARPKPD